MKDKAFLDTNILIYLYSLTELEKQQKIFDIIKTHSIIISVQVVNEFSNICIKKLKIAESNIEIAINDFQSQFIIYKFINRQSSDKKRILLR